MDRLEDIVSKLGYADILEDDERFSKFVRHNANCDKYLHALNNLSKHTGKEQVLRYAKIMSSMEDMHFDVFCEFLDAEPSVDYDEMLNILENNYNPVHIIHVMDTIRKQIESDFAINSAIKFLNLNQDKVYRFELMGSMHHIANQAGKDSPSVVNFIDFFSLESSQAILEKYQDLGPILTALTPSFSFAYTRAKMKEKLAIFGDNDIGEFMNQSKDPYELASMLERMKAYHMGDTICKIGALLTQEHPNKHIFGALKSVAIANTDDDALFFQVVEVIDLYSGNNCEALCKVIAGERERFEKLDLQTLLDADVYEKIKNAKDAYLEIHRIAYNVYAPIIRSISDKEVRDNLQDDDYELIAHTRDFVEKIHEHRSEKDKQKIVQGFYTELDRAINQGTDYNSRIKYLREYCKDVRKQMIDNASELMVVHNE